MKDLILYYNSKKRTIESYDYEEFKNILENNSITSVSKEAQGLLFLSDNGIVKCVKNYYTDKDGGLIPKSKSSDTCFSVLSEFDFFNVNRYECHKCHLRFVNLLESGDVRLRSLKRT